MSTDRELAGRAANLFVELYPDWLAAGWKISEVKVREHFPDLADAQVPVVARMATNLLTTPQ